MHIRTSAGQDVKQRFFSSVLQQIPFLYILDKVLDFFSGRRNNFLLGDGVNVV